MGTNPCIIGVAAKTWHPHENVGEGAAPEPIAMWETVVRQAISDARAKNSQRIYDTVDALEVVYCQTTQYDDAPARLAEALSINPKRKHYSGIGGTTPQQLVNATAQRMLAGELDLAIVVSGESLATQQRLKKLGDRPAYSFRPSEKRPFPWEAPFHPAEVAHEVFQAWLTFAMFDNARRAQQGITLDDYRHHIGEMLSPMTATAAGNPHAWFRTERTALEIVTPTANNRMVGYPYTKFMVSVMDVDMAAALVIATDEIADALGVAQEQRIYIRGWGYATDATYVAEHSDLASSPAMRQAFHNALKSAQIAIDDVEHLDLYSCFPSSLHFAIDALGLQPNDSRPLTLTGGLAYHGGAASGYLTHSIAAMVQQLREDPEAVGLVTGVGMHMTKHVAGVYSNQRNPTTTIGDGACTAHEPLDVTHGAEPEQCEIVEEFDGDATLATYSVVHGRDGSPQHAVLICDVGAAQRCYGWTADQDVLKELECSELIGRPVRLSREPATATMAPKNILTTY